LSLPYAQRHRLEISKRIQYKAKQGIYQCAKETWYVRKELKLQVIVSKPTRTGGKKSKSKDNRPARVRYWLSRTLEKNKIKHLMRNGYTRANALEFWQNKRQGRLKDGFLLTKQIQKNIPS
jgi:tRNA 2-selenouridine synthase SelU